MVFSTITKNRCSINNGYGIYLDYSENNTITYNICNKVNSYGIYLWYYSDSNTISHNNISDNFDGLFSEYSVFNKINNNTFSKNLEYGFYSRRCSASTIIDNIFKDNKEYGLYLSGKYAKWNMIYRNNFINNNGNKSQAYDYTDGFNHNYWNSTTGGNYWSDWTGPDNDSNGIVDKPYRVGAYFLLYDELPLTTLLTIIPEPLPMPLIILVVLLVGIVSRRRLL
jgi:nitrous oxidase accessory protein